VKTSLSHSAHTPSLQIKFNPNKLNPIVLAEELYGSSTPKIIKTHAVDLFYKVYDAMGDFELALFALCHHSTYTRAQTRLGPIANLLNPFDFMDYEKIRAADLEINSKTQTASWRDILKRKPELIGVVRSFDIANTSRIVESSKKNAIFKQIEPEIDAKKGLERISSATRDLYTHFAYILSGSKGELKHELEDFRLSDKFPNLFPRVNEYLKKNSCALESLLSLVTDKILPELKYLGDVVCSSKSRKKTVGSLANKLILKTAENLKKNPECLSEQEVLSFFFQHRKDIIKEHVFDIIAAEIELESQDNFDSTAIRLKRILLRLGFELMSDEVRTKTAFEKECAWRYLVFKSPKEYSNFPIEFQIETKETAFEKQNGDIFGHLKYKGFVLGMRDIKYLMILKEILSKKNGEEQEIVRNLSTITCFENGTHTEYLIPLPEKVSLLDILAITYGAFETYYFSEYLVHGEDKIPFVEFKGHEEIFANLDKSFDTAGANFMMAPNSKRVLTPKNARGVLMHLDNSSFMPKTIPGMVQMQMLREYLKD
ncbi:MAG: hypothetical protein WC309_04455, partial [Candidatus Paceibacterota bacterium]